MQTRPWTWTQGPRPQKYDFGLGLKVEIHMFNSQLLDSKTKDCEKMALDLRT